MQQPATVRWEWIGDGWKLFTQQWGAWVVHMLAFVLVMLIPIIPFYAVAVAASLAAASTDHPEGASILVFLMMLIMIPLVMAAASFLLGGAYKSAMKQLRGEPFRIGDLFSAGDCFLRVWGVVLLVAILGAIGGMLCILPAFIVQGLCFFAIPLVVERRMGPIEAIQASIAATKKDWLMFTVFALVVQIIASAGSILCYVGLLASYPLLFTITSVAYRDVFGVTGANRTQSYNPPPPPDYGMNPPPPSSWQ